MTIQFSKILILVSGLLLIACCSRAANVDAVFFSGGAELDDYQPRVIVPMLTEAFKRNGIKFHAEYIPSARSLYMSNSGMKDGELHRVYNFHEVSNGKYPNLVRIDSKLISVWLAAFSNKDVIINSWEDLKNYTVIYYRGRQNVKQYLEKHLQKNQIFEVNTDRIAFQMLASNRADVVISESHEGKYLINSSSFFGKIKEVAKLEETQIYAYIHNKYDYLAPIIAATLEDMKKDGTFRKIVEHAE